MQLIPGQSYVHHVHKARRAGECEVVGWGEGGGASTINKSPSACGVVRRLEKKGAILGSKTTTRQTDRSHSFCHV